MLVSREKGNDMYDMAAIFGVVFCLFLLWLVFSFGKAAAHGLFNSSNAVNLGTKLLAYKELYDIMTGGNKESYGDTIGDVLGGKRNDKKIDG